jgi:hypothetical protein
VADRNGSQNIYLIDTASLAAPSVTYTRPVKIPFGPRGATGGPDGASFHEALTTFNGTTLAGSIAEKKRIDENLESLCTIVLSNPYSATSGLINARGLEFDPTDSNLWVSDFTGNLFKIVGCETRAAAHVGVRSPAVGTATLSQNIPNPFSATTEITFVLQRREEIRLTVSDGSGNEVAVVASGSYESGEHTVRFDGSRLPSGIYFLRLTQSGGGVVTRTMVCVR